MLAFAIAASGSNRNWLACGDSGAGQADGNVIQMKWRAISCEAKIERGDGRSDEYIPA